MNRRRFALLLGLALLLLAIGVGTALLWPTPSEAELRASLIREGMAEKQVCELLISPADEYPTLSGGGSFPDLYELSFLQTDSSTVFVVFNWRKVASIRTTPPISPLTRLRRSLARIIPALKD